MSGEVGHLLAAMWYSSVPFPRATKLVLVIVILYDWLWGSLTWALYDRLPCRGPGLDPFATFGFLLLTTRNSHCNAMIFTSCKSFQLVMSRKCLGENRGSRLYSLGMSIGWGMEQNTCSTIDAGKTVLPALFVRLIHITCLYSQSNGTPDSIYRRRPGHWRGTSVGTRGSTFTTDGCASIFGKSLLVCGSRGRPTSKISITESKSEGIFTIPSQHDLQVSRCIYGLH